MTERLLPRRAGGLPLVVVRKIDNALRISAVDERAFSLGLHVGQALANAQAMVPALDIVAGDEPADLKLLNRFADWCERYTPLVALDPPHGLFLDVTGTSHLFAGEKPLLEEICETLQVYGFTARGAIAGTAVAARALSRYRPGSIVAPGGEASAVAGIPIDALAFDHATTHAFRRAGLKTIGQVANRKRAEITVRFGAETRFTLDEAQGLAGKPISPRISPPEYWEETSFAEPVATLDVIMSVLAALGANLSKQMEKHGAGARRLVATFFRTDGAIRHITIETSAPTRAVSVIDRLFREKLDALADPLDPGFGFDLVRLAVARADRMEPAILAANSDSLAKSEVLFLVDRLAMRFGVKRLVVFQPRDTHIPETGWQSVPAQYPQPPQSAWQRLFPGNPAPRRPLRLFGMPDAVDVQQRLGSWRKALFSLVYRQGPERIEMEWWRFLVPQPGRDYFRMEDEGGRRFWLYQLTLSGKWFMHGCFA